MSGKRMEEGFLCRIPTPAEMERRWEALIRANPEDRENWLAWRQRALENASRGWAVPYYGFLGERAVAEATAMLCPGRVQNPEGLVGPGTAYLAAFRTDEEFRGQGYFSALFRYMLEDLRSRGIGRVTLGVEPEDWTNKSLYRHLGFTCRIKTAPERSPDGTEVPVEYYAREL